jgi:hypothetical protein
MVLGCLTPLGEFFLARWSDDGQTLSYGDTSISMENFCNFGHVLVQHAEALCDSLIFNWLPEVDLAGVKGDISNTTRGYSFLQHPANIYPVLEIW